MPTNINIAYTTRILRICRCNENGWQPAERYPCVRARTFAHSLYELAYTGNFAAVVVIVIVFSLMHPFKICAIGMDQRGRHFPHESIKRKMTEQIKQMMMMMIALDKSSIIEREKTL